MSLRSANFAPLPVLTQDSPGPQTVASGSSPQSRPDPVHNPGATELPAYLGQRSPAVADFVEGAAATEDVSGTEGRMSRNVGMRRNGSNLASARSISGIAGALVNSTSRRFAIASS